MYLDDVSKLSKDILSKRDVYDELLAIEDDLDREEYAIKMRGKAKELGCVGDFDRMYAAAQKNFARMQKREIAQSTAVKGMCLTDFKMLDADDEKIGQLNCGDWVADDDGVRIHTDKDLLIVCPHPIYISKVLKNVDTGKYKVELVYVVRGKVKRICVNREVITSASKIVKLADDGIQITDITAKMMVKYLYDLESLNPDKIVEHISTSRLGWVASTGSDGKAARQFLPHQSNVIFDNEMHFKPLYDSIKTHGDRDEWYSLVKKIRAKRQPEFLINLAASFASVLVEPCGILPFIVSLWGGTGIGKSVILKVCTSVWADPTEGRYITDPKATYTAMEMRLNILNSLPMTIDDMAQVKNQYDGDFSQLIYQWCSGKGKERSNKELGLNKLTSWHNCIITNGERSIVDESTQGGAINRVIDIEASGDILFDGKEGNEIVKTVESTYGHAGDDFISLIIDKTPEYFSLNFTKQFDRIKALAKSKGVEKEDKQISPMAAILFADELIEKELFQDGIRIDDSVIDYLRNKGEVSEEKNAYEYLKDIIHANYFHFFAKQEGANAVRWGWYVNDNTVAFIPSMFDQVMKDAGYQGKSFRAWAKKQGLIECDKDRKSRDLKTIKDPMSDSRVKAVVIKINGGSDQDINSSQESDLSDEQMDYLASKLPFK